MVLRNDTSRMMGDYHVRFCERLEGETPSCLLSASFVAVVTRFLYTQEVTTATKKHGGHKNPPT